MKLISVISSKLKYIISTSVTEACNNSVLLLGPRGCGKTAVRDIYLYLWNIWMSIVCVRVNLSPLIWLGVGASS